MDPPFNFIVAGMMPDADSVYVQSTFSLHWSPYAQANQDPLRLQAMLRHPETAVDWDDYLGQ